MVLASCFLDSSLLAAPSTPLSNRNFDHPRPSTVQRPVLKISFEAPSRVSSKAWRALCLWALCFQHRGKQRQAQNTQGHGQADTQWSWADAFIISWGLVAEQRVKRTTQLSDFFFFFNVESKNPIFLDFYLSMQPFLTSYSTHHLQKESGPGLEKMKEWDHQAPGQSTGTLSFTFRQRGSRALLQESQGCLSIFC